MILFILSLLILLLTLWGGLRLLQGVRTIDHLNEVFVQEGFKPKVSLIVPARNEAKKIRQCIESLLQQDYGPLEILIINDRSTDETGNILKALAYENPSLKIIEVKELPSAWLGKNYALYLGAKEAGGDYLLFVDADVWLEKSVISRAITYTMQKKLDHLTVVPEFSMPSIILQAFEGFFALFLFLVVSRPWKVKVPESSQSIGIGAFNLVKASTYQAVGTYEAIRLRPDDDLKLAKLIKRKGYRSDVLWGKGAIVVEWYASLKELFYGLLKNSYASADYQVIKILRATLAVLLFYVFPYAMLLFGQGWIFWINALTVAAISFLYIKSASLQGLKAWQFFLVPLSALLFLGVILRATYLNIRRGGIEWRETFYPLSELKQNQV